MLAGMLPSLTGGPSVPAAFQGQRASYVALSAITTLALALLTSIWASDVSGSTAVMGLFAVYLASSELLLLVSAHLNEGLRPVAAAPSIATRPEFNTTSPGPSRDNAATPCCAAVCHL